MASKKEEQTEIAVWQPKTFPGNCLLPLENVAALQVPNIPLVGQDTIDPDDMIIPALALLHGTSKAVTNGVPDAVPGRIMHTGTEDVLSEGPMRILIVHHHKGNALFPKDKPEYKGIETCLSNDQIEGTHYGACAECRKCYWDNDTPNAPPPLGAEVHHFVCMTSMGPVMLRLSRSTYKAGSKYMSTKVQSGKNHWAHPVVVTVTQEPKTLPSGTVTMYHSLKLAWQTTENVPPALQLAAYELYKSVQAKYETGNLKSQDEGTDDATGDFD